MFEVLGTSFTGYPTLLQVSGEAWQTLITRLGRKDAKEVVSAARDYARASEMLGRQALTFGDNTLTIEIDWEGRLVFSN